MTDTMLSAVSSSRCAALPAARVAIFVTLLAISSALTAATAAQPADPQTTDLYGDPLPSGAVARLGTVRYRVAQTEGGVLFLDEGRLVAAPTQGEIVLFDVETGRVKQRIEVNSLRAMKRMPGDKALLCLESDYDREKKEYHCRITVRDLVMGEAKAPISWTADRSSPPQCLGMSADGATIAIGAQGGAVRLWDLTSGDELLKELLAGDSPTSLEFSPDGKQLAIGSRRAVYVWDWTTGAAPTKMALQSERGANVAFSPDGTLLATAGDEVSGVRLWDAKTRELKRRLVSDDPQAFPGALKFTRDGATLAITTMHTHSGDIELWDVATGRRVKTHQNVRTAAIDISPDGKRLAYAAESAVRIWDLAADKVLDEPFVGEHNEVYRMTFTPDGEKIVTAGGHGDVRLWEAATGRQDKRLVHGAGMWVTGLAVSAAGEWLATSADDTVVLWNLSTGENTFELSGHGRLGGRGEREVCFSPDGRRLHSWGRDMFLRTWDVRTGKALAEHALRPSGVKLTDDGDGGVSGDDPFGGVSIAGACFLAGGERLYVRSQSSLYSFDVASGKEQLHFAPKTPPEGEYHVDQVAAPPNSDWLATLDIKPDGLPGPSGPRSWLTTVRLRDLAAPEKVVREIPLPGHFPGELEFSADGRLFASAIREKDDTTWIGVWSVEGKLLHRVKGGPKRVAAMAISPDGRRLATSHFDSTMLVWDLSRFPAE